MTYYTKTPMTTINAIWILEKRVKCNKEEKEEAIQLAIKALKQYGVLQEIRREIDNIDEVALFKETILEILDKHIKEYTV